ncbi:Glycosyl hydrolases family 18 protein [Colletotrichum higginsianum IMI 349063]|uniref:Glycosyl hydrolases family 18 protein n=1 Tax=Colletotrichum higginsianum (strain IMI 349063) TaxID=759273 RepID=A0A1B7XXV4_COLHI|nr:Glycosyl hydrolases family 18 protein [Colletotrichum higginsianum IMI 349063]OBR04589.1 Glycosyl hydrolases family 18 protein [Colletotrichum higginsianum IMI 349063]
MIIAIAGVQELGADLGAEVRGLRRQPIQFPARYPGTHFATFLKELDDANKKQPVKYAVPFTASTSHWHLRHFVLETADQVDFINAMLYGLHGAWGPQEPSKIWHLRVHKRH